MKKLTMKKFIKLNKVLILNIYREQKKKLITVKKNTCSKKN